MNKNSPFIHSQGVLRLFGGDTFLLYISHGGNYPIHAGNYPGDAFLLDISHAGNIALRLVQTLYQT